MAENLRIIYSDDLSGGGRQMILDDEDMVLLLKRIALRDGKVVNEFTIDIDGQSLDIVTFTPDTLLADERQFIESLIERNFELLLELKTIKFRA